jgi:hypothetical protein
MKTSYSRRELYALGEPLGESVTRKEGGRVIYGGGGGGGQQPSEQKNVTNMVAPYAAEYAQKLLGQAGAVTDLMDNPYQSYGGEQVAGFSNLQNQSFNNAQNMRVAPQLGAASDLAYGAGQGASAYGNMGAQAGMSYGQNATNPNAVQAYMNPYLQASLAPQMQMLGQQQGMQQAANQGQAVQAGAFGGSRMGVQNAGQNQANQLAMSNLVGQGYNQAFNTANQNMQQAAALGLQGANVGIAGQNAANTAAANLANIGQNQYTQQMGIINQQNQLGAQQQQYQQNLDTAGYQNFQNQKQYPYQQLGFMSNILQGLPINSTQQSVYSNPSPISVAAGLGTAAIGASKLGGKAGGEVKYAKGGLVALSIHKMGA